MTELSKTPRIYFDRPLTTNATLTLEIAQTHYLKNVLRMKQGEHFRIFNGTDGEWLAAITVFNKNDATVILKGKTREQPKKPPRLQLLFAPLKKDRLDFLIEKSVELGVTDLHPVLTNRTEIRKINEERIQAQMIEAAEQCERLEIPKLHPLTDLRQKIYNWPPGNPILWCNERGQSPAIGNLTSGLEIFLIGPVGGFDDSENTFLGAHSAIKPISLGETILRAETAALMVLSYAKTKHF